MSSVAAPGRVGRVGAGPGDPDWLTVQASSRQSPAILIVGHVLAACRNRSATAAAPGDELRVQRRPGSGT